MRREADGVVRRDKLGNAARVESLALSRRGRLVERLRDQPVPLKHGTLLATPRSQVS